MTGSFTFFKKSRKKQGKALFSASHPLEVGLPQVGAAQVCPAKGGVHGEGTEEADRPHVGAVEVGLRAFNQGRARERLVGEGERERERVGGNKANGWSSRRTCFITTLVKSDLRRSWPWKSLRGFCE